MQDKIIEHQKGGQGYRKISKEINLAPSTVGNIRSMATVQQPFQEMEDREK